MPLPRIQKVIKREELSDANRANFDAVAAQKSIPLDKAVDLVYDNGEHVVENSDIVSPNMLGVALTELPLNVLPALGAFFGGSAAKAGLGKVGVANPWAVLPTVIGTALGGGMGVNALQNKALSTFLPPETKAGLDEYRRLGAAFHPRMQFLGALAGAAPAAGPLRVAPDAITKALNPTVGGRIADFGRRVLQGIVQKPKEAAAAAGFLGATDIGLQKLEDRNKPIDWMRTGMATSLAPLIAQPHGIGTTFSRLGERFGGQIPAITPKAPLLGANEQIRDIAGRLANEGIESALTRARELWGPSITNEQLMMRLLQSPEAPQIDPNWLETQRTVMTAEGAQRPNNVLGHLYDLFRTKVGEETLPQEAIQRVIRSGPVQNWKTQRDLEVANLLKLQEEAKLATQGQTFAPEDVRSKVDVFRANRKLEPTTEPDITIKRLALNTKASGVDIDAALKGGPLEGIDARLNDILTARASAKGATAELGQVAGVEWGLPYEDYVLAVRAQPKLKPSNQVEEILHQLATDQNELSIPEIKYVLTNGKLADWQQRYVTTLAAKVRAAREEVQEGNTPPEGEEMAEGETPGPTKPPTLPVSTAPETTIIPPGSRNRQGASMLIDRNAPLSYAEERRASPNAVRLPNVTPPEELVRLMELIERQRKPGAPTTIPTQEAPVTPTASAEPPTPSPKSPVTTFPTQEPTVPAPVAPAPAPRPTSRPAPVAPKPAPTPAQAAPKPPILTTVETTLKVPKTSSAGIKPGSVEDYLSLKEKLGLNDEQWKLFEEMQQRTDDVAPGSGKVTRFTTEKAPGKGTFVQATRDFKANENVWWVQQVSDSGDVVRSDLGRYMNHSSQPNTKYFYNKKDGNLHATTTRPVASGDEFTVDYQQALGEIKKFRQALAAEQGHPSNPNQVAGSGETTSGVRKTQAVAAEVGTESPTGSGSNALAPEMPEGSTQILDRPNGPASGVTGRPVGRPKKVVDIEDVEGIEGELGPVKEKPKLSSNASKLLARLQSIFRGKQVLELPFSEIEGQLTQYEKTQFSKYLQELSDGDAIGVLRNEEGVPTLRLVDDAFLSQPGKPAPQPKPKGINPKAKGKKASLANPEAGGINPSIIDDLSRIWRKPVSLAGKALGKAIDTVWTSWIGANLQKIDRLPISPRAKGMLRQFHQRTKLNFQKEANAQTKYYDGAWKAAGHKQSVMDRVYEWANEMNTARGGSGVPPFQLTEQEQRVLDLLSAGQQHIRQRQIDLGYDINGRTPNFDPHSLPLMPDYKAMSVLHGNKVGTPEYEALHEDYVNHHVRRGVTPEEAEQWFQEFVKSSQVAEDVYNPNFKPMQRAVGYGLPMSWLDKTVHGLRRYANMSSFDVVHHMLTQSSDPNARAMKQLLYETGENPEITYPPNSEFPEQEVVKGANQFKDVADLLKAHEQLRGSKGGFLDQLNSAAASTLVGVKAKFRDIAGTFGPLAENTELRTVLKNIGTVFDDMVSGASTEEGAMRRRQVSNFFDYGAPGQVINNITHGGRIVTGVEAMERGARNVSFAVGKNIARVAFDEGRPELLDKLLGHKEWRSLERMEVESMAGSKMVQLAQGEYGPEGLPAWLIKETGQQDIGNLMRILMTFQRFGVERANNWTETVVKSLERGEIAPLLKGLGFTALGGAAFDKLLSLFNQKPAEKTWKEFFNSGGERAKEYVVNKLASIGYAGMFSWLANTMYRASTGKPTQEFEAPFMIAVDKILQRNAQRNAAIFNEGRDWVDTLGELMAQLAKDLVQTVQLLPQEDTGNREERLWKEYEASLPPTPGMPKPGRISPLPGLADPFSVNARLKSGELTQEQAGKLIRGYYQTRGTIPQPSTSLRDPRFYKYVEKIQGPEAAREMEAADIERTKRTYRNLGKGIQSTFFQRRED